MKLLLDTHILMWVAGNSDRLTSRARRLLDDRENELIFSAASLWEVALKRLNKADFGADPGVLRRVLIDNGYTELPVSGAHAAATVALPNVHKDPFDRLLLAQAITEGMTLITADNVLASYPGPIRKI